MASLESKWVVSIERILKIRLQETHLSGITIRPTLGYAFDKYGQIVGLAIDGRSLNPKTALPMPQLTRIFKVISRLKNLTRLSLTDLGITSIPPCIAGLEELERVQLYSNSIETIPPTLKQLLNLRHLGLADNKIRRLSGDILDLDLNVNVDKNVTSDGICLRDNPLEYPPLEIVAKGRTALLYYLRSAALETEVLSEVKILFVGDGGSGKTSLVKRVLKRKFRENEPQTHGININDWQLTAGRGDIKAHLWDFGGQEIMHATHQFFLSERSLYVLVLDGRKDEDAEYWLKHVETFGGNSPILVVINKIDQNPGFEINRRFLKSKYNGIRGFFRLSCRNRDGIAPFRRALVREGSNIEITKTVWPKTWFRMKIRLEKMKAHYIGYDEYVKDCIKEGITAKEDQHTLVAFLHDLGTVVHFAELDLRDTHVLEPKWLTKGVYRIINSSVLAQKRGILKLFSLPYILKSSDKPHDYPVSKHSYIVSMMEKFEICYHIDSKTILVPDLLQVQEPRIDFGFDVATKLQIKYDFLPKSVMSRFIVRKHADIKDDLRWRTGVVLHRPEFDATAVVRADPAAKIISIYVLGSQPRDYLTVLRSAFLEINGSYKKLKCEERIPLPDLPETTVSYEHLLRLEREGITELYPEGSRHTYNIQSLLGTVWVEPKRSPGEFIEILKQVLQDSDSRQSVVRKTNDILMLQPNFMGIGVDINKIINKFGKGRRSSS